MFSKKVEALMQCSGQCQWWVPVSKAQISQFSAAMFTASEYKLHSLQARIKDYIRLLGAASLCLSELMFKRT